MKTTSIGPEKWSLSRNKFVLVPGIETLRLSSAALRDTRNADIQNYLGYAYRNTGQLDAAFRHYERALTLSPRHRGAHEYVGEAYLIVNNLAKAEEQVGGRRIREQASIAGGEHRFPVPVAARQPGSLRRSAIRSR